MSPSPLAQPLALIWFLAGAVVFFDGVRWFESTGLLSGQPFSGWDGRAKARLSAASVVALSLLWLSPALFALVAAVGLVVRWRRGARRNGATQGVRLASGGGPSKVSASPFSREISAWKSSTGRPASVSGRRGATSLSGR